MDPDLGAMAFGAEETRLGARSWRVVGLGAIDLGAVDFGAELLPYRSWRLK